jgi:Holliday junction resolvase-like predicted endonuclease
LKGSRFTAEFESTVLLWLERDPISTVAENFRLSWDEVDGIMSRAVARGLTRRKKTAPKKPITEKKKSSESNKVETPKTIPIANPRR